MLLLPLLGLGMMTSASAATTFYGDPPDATHPWAIHDMNRPKPPVVTPGDQPGKPPSDAIILFDGTNLDKWRSAKKEGGPAKWLVRDGYMEVVPSTGDIETIEEFGDCQLHLEWAAPTKIEGTGQGRGNSGVFFMGRCEVQILDNYNNATYADGYAGSIYGVNPPMVNPLRPPGEFQTYDIVFRRPLFKDGKEVDPGRVTVFINGVLVQDCTALEGPTGHMRRTNPAPFPAAGPLKLQDHRNPIRFRNIWYRKLPPRALEGGTDGQLTPEAATAKRAKIGADIRADAQKLPADSREQMLRLAESLMYQKDPHVAEHVASWAKAYVSEIKSLSGNKLEARKDEVRQVRNALDYLARHKILPETAGPAAELQGVIKAQKWDK
jgi:hypothetical protein